MAKKQIKLSEAQLRDMIAENVNKVLTGLDWKTYANARNKADDKGQYERGMKFGNAANKAFNDKFGYQGDEESAYNAPNVRGDIFLNRVEAQNNDYPSHTIKRLYNYDNDKQEYTNPKNYDSTKAFGLMDKYDEDGRYKRIWNPSLKRFFNNPEQEKAYRTASKEMDDYVMGNYGYVKGKGWQLKENKIAKIVAESVKKVLRESGDLYGHYDDGTPFTSSEKTFHGIPGTVFISHGEWSDPEIWYDGEELNANTIEDALWDMYKQECVEQGKNPSEEEYDNLPTE